jgi:hypothetical protein
MSEPIRILYWLLKIGLPLNVVLLTVTPVIGHFNAWPPASSALAQYTDQTPVLLGVGYRKRFNSSGSVEKNSRLYALFPSALKKPSIITVTQINDGTPSVEESEYGLLFLALWYLVCIVGTWWFWFRRVAAQQGVPADVARPAGERRG